MNAEIKTTDDTSIFGVELVRASTSKRLANYIIDFIAFIVVILVLSFMAGMMFPSFFADVDTNSTSFNLLDRLISTILYALFMGTVEWLMAGKSLGKLITKTRAVNLDGSKISAATAFKRGFSRAVPFVVLSAFGTPCDPWQDRWTDTLVIDEKLSFGY
ncbi:MAG: RDD family protein [Bacteroidetes bacterium]|nr:RDD family protein [Bacteroidota bacterium]